MTEKQENILAIALALFADQGYESTPTSQIAKVAGVSEGLIFRHFKNKEGLLAAIVNEGTEKIEQFIAPILREKDPLKIIHHTIDLPATIIKNEKQFWALQYTLKTHNAKYTQVFNETEYLNPLLQAVLQAFSDLKYAQPQQETKYLFLVLHGLTSILLSPAGETQGAAMIQFIKGKYSR